MKFPKISIVIPCYNAVESIEATLQSLFKQDYNNVEIIVIDGASTDGTVQVIEKYCDKIDYFVTEKDRGQTHAINKGFAVATGDIFNWLCADDLLIDGALLTISRCVEKNPDANMYIGQCKRIFPDGLSYVTKPDENVLERIGYHNGIDQPACFWSAKLHKSCGVLDEKYFHAMDWDWWNRLKKSGGIAVIIKKKLAVYNFPEDSKTSTGGNRQMKEMYEIVKKYGPLNGALAEIYLYLYENYDLKGCYDTPSSARKDLILKRDILISEMANIFGKDYIYSYNWNFCSKQERNLCWYR